MFRIIGADEKEYGPIDAEQMRRWIREGRVNLGTKIQSDAGPEWKAAREFSEFRDLFQGAVVAPPVLPTGAPPEPKTSGMAITSLVLGILGWLTLGVTALVGFILGIVALVRIGKSQGALKGTGLALAGTILSGVFLLALPILAALLLPALAKAKARAQTTNCMNNLKQLGLGTMMYANDNHNQFPSGTNWCEAVVKYLANRRVFQCPAERQSKECDYAFNEKLSGIDLKAVRSPESTVLIFESDGGWNASGGSEMVLSGGRHQRVVGLVFADGHAEMAGQARVRRVQWDP